MYMVELCYHLTMKNMLIPPQLFFILIILSLVFLLFDNLGLLFFPKLAAQTVLLPIQYGFYQVGRSTLSQFQFLLDARFAALENKALRKQLSELTLENAVLNRKLKEDETLIDEPNRLSPKVFDLVPARVVGLGRNLMIDKGSQDGVTQSQVVVYQENFVGQINRVSLKTAQVLLPFDPDSKLAVFSQNKGGRARGILLGQFGSQLLMDKILHQEPVEVGDLVYSEGLEGKLPRGLILGQIERVFENQNEVFKQAKVKPIFDLYDLDVVFIMKGT